MSVTDDSIDGEQAVALHRGRRGTGARSSSTLEYRIRERNPLTPVVDRLFVRPAMRASLQATLLRFGVTLAEAQAAGPA